MFATAEPTQEPKRLNLSAGRMEKKTSVISNVNFLLFVHSPLIGVLKEEIKKERKEKHTFIRR